MLDRSVRDDGERLFVLDLSQDLYQRSKQLTDEWLSRSGFRQWVKLDCSCWLSYRVADMLTEHGVRFLDAQFDPPQPDDPTFNDTTLRWVASAADLVEIGAREIAHAWDRIDSPDVLALADVFHICLSRELGGSVTNELRRAHSIRTRGTVRTGPYNEKSAKQAFWPDDARVKGSTPYSVKGWEARTGVILADDLSSAWSRSALYVSMSRVKAHESGSLLTVVSANRDLLDFAREYFTGVGA